MRRIRLRNQYSRRSLRQIFSLATKAQTAIGAHTALWIECDSWSRLADHAAFHVERFTR
jgi:hypothetical protein